MGAASRSTVCAQIASAEAADTTPPCPPAARRALVASSLAAGANALTLTADGMAFNGGANSVNGSSTILLQPGAVGSSVGIGGGVGTLQVTTADITALQDGFSGITIGRSDGTGLVT